MIAAPDGYAVKFLLMDFSMYYRRYNIAPTSIIPGIVYDKLSNSRQHREFVWGLVPSWAKDTSGAARMINARAETLAEKSAFRSAFKYRRCLLPSSGFYEWKKQGGAKQPYLIKMKDGGLFAFAGLYELWDRDGSSLNTATIITCPPNELVAPIHDRMPVILPQEHYEEWLNPDITDTASLSRLLVPFDEGQMEMYPVTPAVGNPRYDNKSCIEPVEGLF